jgi:hypothetical protein
VSEKANNAVRESMFQTVGSLTQRRQPAPSVTSERGTVLVNFVGFGNRFLFFQKWAEGRYLLE